MKFYIGHVMTGALSCERFDTLEELLAFIDEGYTDADTCSVRVYPKEEYQSVPHIEIFDAHKE